MASKLSQASKAAPTTTAEGIVQETLARWQSTPEIVILPGNIRLQRIFHQAIVFVIASVVLTATVLLIWLLTPTRDWLAILLLTMGWALIFSLGSLCVGALSFLTRISEKVTIDWSAREFKVVREYLWGKRQWQYPFSQVQVAIWPNSQSSSEDEPLLKCYQLQVSFCSQPVVLYTSSAIAAMDWPKQHHLLSEPLLPAAQLVADQFGVIVTLPPLQR
jgi:hypothetical protein